MLIANVRLLISSNSRRTQFGAPAGRRLAKIGKETVGVSVICLGIVVAEVAGDGGDIHGDGAGGTLGVGNATTVADGGVTGDEDIGMDDAGVHEADEYAASLLADDIPGYRASGDCEATGALQVKTAAILCCNVVGEGVAG